MGVNLFWTPRYRSGECVTGLERSENCLQLKHMPSGVTVGCVRVPVFCSALTLQAYLGKTQADNPLYISVSSAAKEIQSAFKPTESTFTGSTKGEML